MSEYEQYMLELVNRARLDPLGEAERLGIDLNKDLPPSTLTGEARQPLVSNFHLIDSSRDHSQWMLDNDTFNHTGVGGSSAGERMENAGYVFTGTWAWGENIIWQGTTGIPNLTQFVASEHGGLFISAGHRLNILNDNFREIGIGIQQGPFIYQSSTFNTVMTTQNFAKSGTDYYFTGVVYSDNDGDEFYSVGEGNSGVAVNISLAGVPFVSTASEAAGGFRAAVGNGTYDLTFSGGSLSKPVTLTTTVYNSNVKIDLVGTNTLESSASVILGQNAVELKLLGVADLSATGNSGINRIFGNAGDNALAGGAGDDALWGGSGNDVLDGGLGNDSIQGESGDDTIDGGSGKDSILGATGKDTIFGGDGDDIVHSGKDADTVDGQDGADILRGGSGNDLILGATGNDIVYGGEGDDFVHGGKDDDTIDGQDGADHLKGGSGTDSILGSTGNDTIYGGLGDDVIHSGKDDDIVDGQDGRDSLRGGSGNDSILGATGNDTMQGGTGDDYLHGGKDDDVIDGQDGADTLKGGSGNDVLIGGQGRDILTGGIGDDVFDYNAAFESLSGVSNRDSITGFDNPGLIGGDRIDISNIETFVFLGTNAFTGTGLAELRAENAADDSILQGDVDGDGIADLEILIQFVTASTLTAEDFIGLA